MDYILVSKGCSSKVPIFHMMHCLSGRFSLLDTLEKKRQWHHWQMFDLSLTWNPKGNNPMMITHWGWLYQLQKSLIFVLSTWDSIFICSKPYILLDYEGMIKTSSSLSHLPQAITCGSVPPKPGLSVLSSPTDSYHILLTSDSVLLCSHLHSLMVYSP